MSYLELAKRLQAETDARGRAVAGEPRLTAGDCLELMAEMDTAIEAHYEPGAYPWAMDRVAELAARFKDTEADIDRLAEAGPTEGEFRAAMEAHVAVWREASARLRALRERAADGDQLKR